MHAINGLKAVFECSAAVCCHQMIHFVKVKLGGRVLSVCFPRYIDCLHAFKIRNRYSEVYIFILAICTVIS